MEAFCRGIIITNALFFCLYGCQTKGPSTDSEENKFFSLYRDIYSTYNHIPVDSTKGQLEVYLSKFPENASAWAFYGNVQYKLKNYASAKDAYWRAIKLDGKRGVYYSSLGAVYTIENKADSAEEYLLKGVRSGDSSGYTFLNLAMLYSNWGKMDKASKFADETVPKADSSSAVYAGLSYVYSKLSNPAKSTEMAALARITGLKDTAGLNDVLLGKMKVQDFYSKNY